MVSATWTRFLHPLSSSTHRSTLVGWEETSRTEQTHQEAFMGATRTCLHSSWEMKASLRMQVGSSVVWAMGTIHCDLPLAPHVKPSQSRRNIAPQPLHAALSSSWFQLPGSSLAAVPASHLRQPSSAIIGTEHFLPGIFPMPRRFWLLRKHCLPLVPVGW